MPSRGRHKLVCAVALFCHVGSAEPEPSARDHFAHAVELARQGELDAAAAEFQTAYRLSPNYVVLYNLGQAYAGLGKPVEAVRAFQQYLEGAGTKISAQRRHEVEQLIVISKKRIGFLSLTVEPTGSDISIDGRSIGASPLRERISLVVGSHSVRVETPERTPFTGSVEILPTKDTALKIELTPATLAVTRPAEKGLLSVVSEVPAANIVLDSDHHFDLGQMPIIASVGAHDVTCERRGYISSRHHVEVVENIVTRVSCELKEAPALPKTQTGNLSFLIDQPGAHVWVDGRSSRENLTLPAGPHRVLISCAGFDDWVATEILQPGLPLTVKVHLSPTPEHALRLHDAARSRRRAWAYVLGGTGLALIGTAAYVYASDTPRYAAWRSDHEALSRDIQNQRWSSNLSDRAADLQSRAASIRGRDDLAIGTGVLGAAVLGYAVVSWLAAGE